MLRNNVDEFAFLGYNALYLKIHYNTDIRVFPVFWRRLEILKPLNYSACAGKTAFLTKG